MGKEVKLALEENEFYFVEMVKLGYVLHLKLDKNQPFHIYSGLVNKNGRDRKDVHGLDTEINWYKEEKFQKIKLHFIFDGVLGLDDKIHACKKNNICLNEIANQLLSKYLDEHSKIEQFSDCQVKEIAKETYRRIKGDKMEDIESLRIQVEKLVVSASYEIAMFLNELYEANLNREMKKNKPVIRKCWKN